MMYVLLVILFILILYFAKRSRLDFPGPTGWPIFGNLFSINPTKMHVTFLDWSNKYGSVYKVNLLGNEGLVITDIHLFRDLLVTRGDLFAGRPQLYELIDVIGKNSSEIFFSQPTKIWKNMRKNAHSTLKQHGRGLKNIEEISMTALSIMLEDIRATKQRTIDPHEILYTTTKNIIAALLVGKTYESMNRFLTLITELETVLQDILDMRIRGAILDAFPFVGNICDIFQSVRKRYDIISDELAVIVLEEADQAEDHCLAAVWQSSVEKGEMSLKLFSANVATLILAGTRTTFNTMNGFINIMIHKREIQKKLQEESEAYLGSRSVKLSDREFLPFHMATLQELLRFTTIDPLGVTHTPLCDTNIAGKHVPAGTQIHFNHLGVNHCPKNFPEPGEFKPERFLDDEGKFVLADHPNRRNMNAFGAGPRVCLGETLARARLFLFIASLMQNFDILPPDDSPLVPIDPRNYKFSITALPPSCRARFVPRNCT